MSGIWRHFAAVGTTSLLAAACADTSSTVALPPHAVVYKVGQPYMVADTWYYPHEQPSYDETGLASWYGADFHGHLTADGEIFDRNALTAAHPTLPLPTNVRVTNLENGKSIVVRVNDRGPFKGGRLIDLSERAADLLGYKEKGLAPVRVTYVGRADTGGSKIVPPAETPPDIAVAVAAAPTQRVQEASLVPVASVPEDPVPPPQIKVEPVYQPIAAPAPEVPDGKVTQVPVSGSTAIFVQAGAFAAMENASRVVTALKSLGAGVSPTSKDGHAVYRVRIGPFGDPAQAAAMLARVQGLGHNEARIVVD